MRVRTDDSTPDQGMGHSNRRCALPMLFPRRTTATDRLTPDRDGSRRMRCYIGAPGQDRARMKRNLGFLLMAIIVIGGHFVVKRIIRQADANDAAGHRTPGTWTRHPDLPAK